MQLCEKPKPSCSVVVLLAPQFYNSRLAVGVNAVDAPRRRVHLHAQPAGHFVQVRRVMRARRGVFALGKRHVEAAVAVTLDRGDGRVLGYERDGLHVGPWV